KLIFELAFEMFGIKKYWHKRIVRCGKNTLYPYNENPENLILKNDDILFLDFGPIFEDWEADFGRTYVVGNDPVKIKLKADIENAWTEGKNYFKNQTEITGAQLYTYCNKLALKYGWEFGGEIAGHIIGQYPHEKLEKEDKTNYIHRENHSNMFGLNKKGEKKHWILEIHFVDKEKEIGGFFEQLLA
ncbi:aminopeptidase P family protein, partial [bacterium]|nr:aminopeptidase P family protein [bacterium]